MISLPGRLTRRRFVRTAGGVLVAASALPALSRASVVTLNGIVFKPNGSVMNASVGSGSSPSWYTAMTAGQWGQIPDSKLKDCVGFETDDTFPPYTGGSPSEAGSWTCISAYGGGAHIKGTGFIYNGTDRYDGDIFYQKGGGHRIGAQGTHFFPFLYDTPSGTPKWKKHRDSRFTGGGAYIAVDTNGGSAFDSNGDLVATQTYDSLSYIEADNAVLQMCQTFGHRSDLDYQNSTESVKINVGQSSPNSNNPYSAIAVPPIATGCGCSAHELPNGSNGTKGTIWFQGQGDGKFSSYDVAANTYGTLYSLSYAAASQPTLACDQNRGILCVTGIVDSGAGYDFGIGMIRTSNIAGDWYGYTGHNGAAPMGMMVQNVGGTPDAGTPTAGDASGNDPTILWNPDLDCFVVWYGGKTLWKLVPPATNPYKSGNRWTWTPITPAGGDDPSPTTSLYGSTGYDGLAQGTYQRFGYISNALCRGYYLIHGPQENVYFYKV